jgi:hypothetical protein
MTRISPGNGILQPRLRAGRVPKRNSHVRCAVGLVIMAAMVPPNWAMEWGTKATG